MLLAEKVIEENKDRIRAEILQYKDQLKDTFVPKPISTFHTNENEYINLADKDRLKRREKVSKHKECQRREKD